MGLFPAKAPRRKVKMREKSEPLINTNEHEFFGGGKRVDKRGGLKDNQFT